MNMYIPISTYPSFSQNVFIHVDGQTKGQTDSQIVLLISNFKRHSKQIFKSRKSTSDLLLCLSIQT